MRHGLSARIILVILAVLAMPYVVDVCFYGDFTPTHFAQENRSCQGIENWEEGYNAKALDEHTVLSIVEEPVPLQPYFPFLHGVVAGRFSSSDRLVSAALVTRPPPTPRT